MNLSAEQTRLNDHYSDQKNWLKWGPYLAERQRGTNREDYSANGDAWNYIWHDMARSKAYRCGEEGIAGFSDDKQRLCKQHQADPFDSFEQTVQLRKTEADKFYAEK